MTKWQFLNHVHTVKKNELKNSKNISEKKRNQTRTQICKGFTGYHVSLAVLIKYHLCSGDFDFQQILGQRKILYKHI